MARPPKPPRAKREKIQVGFKEKTITLPLDQIVPLRIIDNTVRKSTRYKQITVSIETIGIIEPPVVTPDKEKNGRYMLLDGHLRIEALKILGETEVTCIVSTDDESFTYNKHFNGLSPIQEHRMILKAVERGVPEEKIAQALSLDVKSISKKRSLLEGICPEAADLLKDKMVPGGVFPILKKMAPVRQVEAATLMNDANIYSSLYAKAILAATPQTFLKNPSKPKKIKGLTPEQMIRMENEMAVSQREFKMVEDSYNENVLNLMVARKYLAHLLDNAKIVRYLAQNHPEFLTQFQEITVMTSLGEMNAA